MGAYQVLHSEPRYKVDNFVSEIVGRRQETIQLMRPQLMKFLTVFAEQIDMLRLSYLGLDLTILKFRQPTWTRAGVLVLTFQQIEQAPETPEPRYHVDEVVNEVFDHEPRLAPMKEEVSQFLAAFIDQFSVMRKHGLIDLTNVTFPGVRWAPDGALLCDIVYDGRPMGPQDVRWS